MRWLVVVMVASLLLPVGVGAKGQTGKRWMRQTVRVLDYTGEASGMPAAVAHAAAVWSDAAPRSPTLVYVRRGAKPCHKVKARRKAIAVCVAAFDDWGFTQLAHGEGRNQRRIDGAKIILSRDLANPLPPWRLMLRETAAHELGHALGLSHSRDRAALMTGRGDCLCDRPQPADLARLAQRYRHR